MVQFECPKDQNAWMKFTSSTKFKDKIGLRVIAWEKDGVYYMSCPRPESDFDEIRTRGGPGPKTKFGDPLSAHSACAAGPGAAKTAIFLLSKIRVFGHIFFISNRTDMFAMGFW